MKVHRLGFLQLLIASFLALEPLQAVNVPPESPCPKGLSFHEVSGQRFRRISLDGLPIVAPKGQAKAESDENSEESYVDSLTLQLRHDTSDIYVPLPGNELSLGAKRSIATEMWSSEPGEKPYHTLPYERPFGHCWSSGLGAHIKVITEIFPPDSGECPSSNPEDRIVVVDENGSPTDFMVVWVPEGYDENDEPTSFRRGFLPLPSNRTSQDQFLNRLEYDETNNVYVLTRKFGTKVSYAPVSGLPPVQIILNDEGTRQRIITYYRALKVEDRLGNELNFEFDSGNNTLTPDRVVSDTVDGGATDRTLTITRNGSQVGAITDPNGNQWTFTYSSETYGGSSVKLLTSVRTPLGSLVEYDYEKTFGVIHLPSAQAAGDPPETWYHMNLTSITSGKTDSQVQGPSGAVSWSQPQNVTQISYQWDHTVRSWDYVSEDDLLFEYDPAVMRPRIVSTTGFSDGSGATFAPTAASLADPVRMTASAANGGATEGNILGIRAFDVVDADGNPRVFTYENPLLIDAEEIKDLLKGENGIERFPSYSVLWCQCILTQPTSVNEVANYDPTAALADILVTDYSGNSTSYIYIETYNIFEIQFPDLYANDPRLQAITHPLFNPKFAEPRSETNSLPATTNFKYYSSDGVGITSPASRVMTEIIDAEGRKTVYQVDQNTGNRLKEQIFEADGTLVRETTFTYGHPSFKGFVTETRVKNAIPLVGGGTTDLVTTYTPDGYGYVATTTIDPGGLNITTNDVYDANGNKTSSTDARGITTTYTFDNQNRLTGVTLPASGAGDPFAYSATTLQTGYDPSSNKVWETDGRGVLTYYAYDRRNRLVATVTDMDDSGWLQDGTGTATDIRSTTAYNDVGTVVATVDPNNTATVTLVDSMQRPESVSVDPTGLNLTTTYEYGTNSGGWSFRSDGFKSTRTTDPRGYVTIHTYDNIYRTVSTSKEYEAPGDGAGAFATTSTTYDAVGNVLTSTDPRGQVTASTYDALNRPVTVTLANGTSYAQTTQYYYTSELKWKSVMFVGTTSERSSETDYDTAGRAIKEWSPEPATGLVNRSAPGNPTIGSPMTESVYDANGNIIQVIDPLGNATDTTYDSRNRPTKVEMPAVTDAASPYSPVANVRPTSYTEYDQAGNVVRTIDARQVESVIVYDNANRVTSTTDAFGLPEVTTTTTTYDENGNVLTVTDGNLNKTQNVYDAANRLIATATNPVTGQPSSDPINTPNADDIVVKNQYDAGGFLLNVTDGEDQVTGFRYDGLGRKTHTIWDEGSSLERIELSTYDGVVMVSRTDPLQRTISYTYDALHRPTLVQYSGNSADNRSYTHDPAGNILSVSYTSQTIRNVTQEFDHLNRTISETSAGVTHTSYYDKADNLLRQTYGNGGKVLTNHYDALNRIERIDESASGSAVAATGQLEFLPGGWVNVFNGRTFTIGNEVFTVGVEMPPHTYYNSNEDVIDGIMWAITSNNVLSATRLNGTTISFTAKVPGVTGNSIPLSSDMGGLTQDYDIIPMSGGADAPTTHSTYYAYDLNSNVTDKKLPNLTRTLCDYDALGQVRTKNTFNSSGGVIATFDYSQAYGSLPSGYDRAGNVVYVVESYGDPNINDRTVTNVYDKTNRLKEEIIFESGASITETFYGYDDAHNRISKVVTTDTVLTSQLDYYFGTFAEGYNSNQVKLVNDGTTSTTFEYDANGNRSYKKVNGATVQSYTWDHENRLTQVIDTAGTYVYAYDHRNRRVVRDESLAGGQSDEISYSGGLSAQEYQSGQTTPFVEYIRGSDYGGGIGGVLYTVRGSDRSYNAYNSRGDVVSKTNQSEVITWQASYEAFGSRTQEQGTTADRQKANTKEEDPTGLLNEGERYRDIEFGIFISRDPAGFIDGTNVYTYVRQNPWTSFDPHGLWGWRKALSFVADFVPVVSTVKSVIEVTTGYDPISGEKLSAADRALSAAGLVPGGKLLKHAKKGVEAVAAIKKADKVADTAKAVTKAADSTRAADKAVTAAKKTDDAGGAATSMRKTSDSNAAQGIGGCFIAGTLISTETGMVPIEMVKTGDTVKAYDLELEVWETREVVEVFTYQYSGDLFEIHTNGETISATSEHPFFVLGRADDEELPSGIKYTDEKTSDHGVWLPASELQTGDQLLTTNGSILTISQINASEVNIPVFNFHVRELHNYAVGSSGILVHNNCSAPAPSGASGPSKAEWKAKIHGTAQKTGTPGHQFRMYREAITEAKKANVTSVHLDHGYNRALGLDPKTISPNRRPDVVSVYDNNMVRRVEVQSKTDVPAVLGSRNSALDQQLRNNGFTPTPPVVVKPTTSQ